jgi:hypothetical protein
MTVMVDATMPRIALPTPNRPPRALRLMPVFALSFSVWTKW